MPVQYRTIRDELAVPSESNRPLHSYHNAIESRLTDTTLHGLIGKDDGIQRLVVSETLSTTEQSDIEDYLSTDIIRVEE